MIQVPTIQLKKICNPFKYDPCDCGITEKHVKHLLPGNNPSKYIANQLDGNYSLKEHTERIVNFILFGFNDPISIDVGIPFIGYCPDWMIADGNHRLAAAIYTKTPFILAEIAGDVEYAEKLFKIKLS